MQWQDPSCHANVPRLSSTRCDVYRASKYTHLDLVLRAQTPLFAEKSDNDLRSSSTKESCPVPRAEIALTGSTTLVILRLTVVPGPSARWQNWRSTLQAQQRLGGETYHLHVMLWRLDRWPGPASADRACFEGALPDVDLVPRYDGSATHRTGTLLYCDGGLEQFSRDYGGSTLHQQQRIRIHMK